HRLPVGPPAPSPRGDARLRRGNRPFDGGPVLLPAPGAGHAPVQGPADWNLPPAPPQRMGPGPAILGPHPRPRDPPRPAPCGLVRLPQPWHVGRSYTLRYRLRLPLGERPRDRYIHLAT